MVFGLFQELKVASHFQSRNYRSHDSFGHMIGFPPRQVSMSYLQEWEQGTRIGGENRGEYLER